MSLVMKLIFGATGPRTLRAFAAQCAAPRETQNNLLRHLMAANAQSAYGQAHDFSSIKNFEDFQRALPIVTYDDLESYIQKALHGEPNQLTREAPVLFATTSGTTGASKFIPVTPEGRSAKSQLMRVWLSAFFRDHPGIFEGQILTVVSPEVESRAPCGVPCGAESGHAYVNMPRAMRAMYSTPYDVFEIKSYDAKYYTLLRVAASQSITFLVTCNPSTILVLCERLKRYSEQIVRDVRDGGLGEEFEISSSLRAQLKAMLPPNAKRAAELERIAERNAGVLLPRDVWPNLSGIGCWKGGTVGMYLEKFDEYFRPDTPIRDLGYLASEHRGSVPISDEGDAGVLAIPTNIYEFFPVDADRKPQGHELLGAADLELGKQYYIYVTTFAGLYRYDMNDIVEVTGFYEKTPLIRFVQKGKGVVSFTGEKLSESQVLAAVSKAFGGTKYEFIAAIGEMHEGTPRYVFLTEFAATPRDSQAQNLVLRLENALKVANIEYASKRDSARLLPSVLRIIQSGEFDRYRTRQVENGKLDGQFKIMRLTTDTQFAAEFVSEREYSAA